MSAEPSAFDEADDRDIFDVSEEEDARRDAEAIAQADAGRSVPHEEVAAWLRTWGTPDEKPAPAHWFK